MLLVTRGPRLAAKDCTGLALDSTWASWLTQRARRQGRPRAGPGRGLVRPAIGEGWIPSGLAHRSERGVEPCRDAGHCDIGGAQCGHEQIDGGAQFLERHPRILQADQCLMRGRQAASGAGQCRIDDGDIVGRRRIRGKMGHEFGCEMLVGGRMSAESLQGAS